jgi:hypothetical protein
MSESTPARPGEADTPPRAPVPYVGPAAFAIGQPLYGRDWEAIELLDLIASNRIVLLHSPSGAGKTSLIHAKLIPSLKNDFEFTIYGPIRVRPTFQRPDGGGANRFVYSVLCDADKSNPSPLSDAELATLTLDEYLARRETSAERKEPGVLIFDQFEEIITTAPGDLDAKREFFRQLGDALRPRHRWALFSIREEYVAALDPYVHSIPTGLSCRYQLRLLSASAAREAIAKPAEGAGKPFTHGALKRLVQDLCGHSDDKLRQHPDSCYIEPVHLQVVCTQIWDALHPTDQVISEKRIREFGNVNSALAQYYDTTVAKACADCEVDERRLRGWMGTALISNGLRVQVAAGSESAFRLNPCSINVLVDAYLVRVEERRMSDWYELAHERLIVPIVNSNLKWHAKNASDAQRMAEWWISRGRLPEGLPRGRLRKQLLEWEKRHVDELSPELQEFLNATRAARRTVAAWIVFGLGSLLLVSILITLKSQDDKLQAERAMIEAQRARMALADSFAVLRARSDLVLRLLPSWGYEELRQLPDTLELALSAAADSVIQTVSPAQSRAPRNFVQIRYFRQPGGQNIEPALRSLGFDVDIETGSASETNSVAYGSRVSTKNIKLVALALLRAGVDLRRVCPFVTEGTRSNEIQVLGASVAEPYPLITLEQVDALTDSGKQINCGRVPTPTPPTVPTGQPVNTQDSSKASESDTTLGSGSAPQAAPP